MANGNDVPPGGSETTGGQGDQPTTAEVQQDPGKDPTPPPQDPKNLPSAPDSQKPEDPYGTEHRVYLSQLEDLQRRADARDYEIRSQLMPDIQKLQQMVNTPLPQAPQPVQPPTPPTEQQKGGLSEFIMNVLKFGALVGIAYGTRGRAGASLSKLAIGSALQGYANARKDVVNQSMQLYEKNRQYANDLNKQQNQEYHNLIQDERLSLQQKMDLINSRARFYGDLNTADAAKRQNLKDVIDRIEKQKKLQQDKEKEDFRSRDKFYDSIGDKNFTARYLAWLTQKTGKVWTRNSDPNELAQLEHDHPDWSVAAFQKE